MTYRVCFVAIFLFLNLLNTEKCFGSSGTLVITAFGSPKSFDPLTAFSIRNRFLFEMIYSQPFVITGRNSIKSALFSSYSYDQGNNKLALQLKESAFYTDGKPITSDDVLLAFKRVILKFPQIASIRDIHGKSDWLKRKYPLEENLPGLYARGNKIFVNFNQPQKNPIVNFAMTIFSVLPRKCISLKTNKLICKQPPLSGLYTPDSYSLKSYSDNSKIVFNLNRNIGLTPISTDTKPSGTTFKTIKVFFRHLWTVKEVEHEFSDEANLAIYSTTDKLSRELIPAYRDKFHLRFYPKNMITYVLFNPNHAVFEKSVCRNYFADELRQVSSEQGINNSKITKSFFPILYPGYIPSEKFGWTISPKNRKQCSKIFEREKIYTYLSTDKFKYFNAINGVIQKLNLNEIHLKSVSGVPAFTSGKTSFVFGYLKLPTFDTASGLSSIFSEGRSFITKYLSDSDPEFRKYLDDLQKDASQESFKNLNNYIYQDARLSVLNHYGYLLLIGKNLPMAGKTSTARPKAWEIFGESY